MKDLDTEERWSNPEWWNARCSEALGGHNVTSAVPGARGGIKQAYTSVLPYTLRLEGGGPPGDGGRSEDGTGGADQRVVLKRVILDPGALGSPGAPGGKSSRGSNRAKSYLVEASFYQHCGPRLNKVGARVPVVLHCDNSTSEELEMVLEDVTGATSGWNETTDRSEEQALVLKEEKALCALDWAARLHAEFWGERSEGAADGLWAAGGYWGLEKRQKELAATEAEWKKTVASFEAEYPRVFGKDSVRDLGRRLKSAAVPLSNELSADQVWDSSRFATVVHGDFKTANMFFSKPEGNGGKDEQIAVCDFQWAGRGLGVLDVVYLLYTSCEPELIAQKEEELLRHYHSRLLFHLEGAGDREAALQYTWNLFMHHYEAAYLDYVRFLLGRMWGSISPEVCRGNVHSLNQGTHKRYADHLVAMVVKADNLMGKLEAAGWPVCSSRSLISADNVPVALRVLDACADLACRAGEVIRTHLEDAGGSMSASKDKADFGYGEPDPQTLADLAAERLIINGLAGAFPDLKVIGEEGEAASDVANGSGDQPGGIADLRYIPGQAWRSLPSELLEANIADMCVWVDPLDGTQEFVDGNFDRVTVLLGISVKGRPMAGAILQPFVDTEFGGKGRLLWGALGLGVWDGDARGIYGASRLPVEPCPKTVVATTRSHPSEAVQAAADALNPHETRRVGGAGSKVVMILQGEISHWVYPRKGTKRWDTAAPEALLRASGGFCVDAQGRPYDYSESCEPRNDAGVIAGGCAVAWQQCVDAYGWKEAFPS